MRMIAFFIVCIVGIINLSAQTVQTYNLDSLKKILSKAELDTSRIWVLLNLGRNIQNSDSMLLLARQALSESQRLSFFKGEAEAYANMGYWYNQKGNYPAALSSYLRSIQISESIHYEAGLKRSFNSIATVFIYVKDYSTSISYSKKARNLSIKLNDKITHSLASSWLSKGYFELKQTDSALTFAQEGYQVATQINEVFPLYLATARLSEINSFQNNQALALEYARMSVFYSKKDGRNFRIAGAHQDLSKIFYKLGQYDSCLWHAKHAFGIAQSDRLLATLLASSLMLSKLYESRDDSQSLRFHKLALEAQDSLFSQERNREVEVMNMKENLRQQKLEEIRLQELRTRSLNLQYAATAFGVIVFLMIFLLLSHSIIANEKLIKFLGILALLIVFEFINLLLHPVVGNITHHSPFLMLLFMVCIAALLIPLHHRLEKWITHKLVEKNKQIRLAAAKKIIATLDGDIEK